LTATTDTYLLLAAFVDELCRCGMTDACTSPGSRCAPLVLTLAREERLRTHSHIDERAAGFFALGAAKASARPVAVTCTSGTAAVNLAPAVTEAHEARVPLIVLTADRPPELRDVGAGQTIDQIKLYGNAVRWFVEVGTHSATVERLRWMRSLACRAYWTACGEHPGPVHLNWPLREPLVPDAAIPELPPGRPGARPWTSRATVAVATLDMRDVAAVADRPRGLIVAGRSLPSLAPAIAAIAESAGWPLLADPLSGARRGAAAIAHYDALLRDARFAALHAPDLVVRVGELPTSKPLRSWLAALDATQVALDPLARWQDPEGAVAVFADAGALGELPPAEPGWLEAWRAADERASRAIEATLADQLSEPRVARALGEWLPASATLVVASSMPVRDVETFWPQRDDGPLVLANRGANGIDGTVSTAFGVAAVRSGPTVLLTGDVALAHDVGGLLAASRLGLALTIVVLENGGGGIFDFLPVAGERDVFEEHVATPPGLELERVAALYGFAHQRPATLAELALALERATATGAGATLIEVRTRREENVALHRRVWEAVADAL
jgi:2-succinyl-5-enolpyruvyl-6-hydroxy-3-cyclohexene-1-carboxylate synthase